MVVPVGAAVKLVGPNREPDVLPKGLEVVFVVPKRPPLLVLVPKSLKKIKTRRSVQGQTSILKLKVKYSIQTRKHFGNGRNC